MSKSSVTVKRSGFSSASYTPGRITKNVYSLGSSPGRGLGSALAGSGSMKVITSSSSSNLGRLQSGFPVSASSYGVYGSSGGSGGSGGSLLFDLSGAGYGGGSFGVGAGFGSGTGLGARCGGGIVPPITNVTVDKRLLAPLDLAIDPMIGQIRTQEKNEIKTLNNKFAGFIDKVRYLEQTNKMLETKWALLQQQQQGGPDSVNLDAIYQARINNMRMQLDCLNRDKDKLNSELHNMENLAEDFKKKYEDEINDRTTSENEFVTLKKDVDAAFLLKYELGTKLNGLQDEINFLKELHNAELDQMNLYVKDVTAIIEMDNRRDFDMSSVLEMAKAHYEDMAKGCRAEAETYYQSKYDELVSSTNRYGDDIRNTKAEIAEMNRNITRIKNEIEHLKRQNANLEGAIAEAEERGEKALQDARQKLAELEAALQKAKEEMARMIREYQDLMNIKLGLDMEIACYRKMLEGEEQRISGEVTGDTKIYLQQTTTTTSGRGVGGGLGVASGAGGSLSLASALGGGGSSGLAYGSGGSSSVLSLGSGMRPFQGGLGSGSSVVKKTVVSSNSSQRSFR